VLTLDQFGISEEDWNQTPSSVRAALMFLLQQNQRLENRCYTYELEVQRLKAQLEGLRKLELEVVCCQILHKELSRAARPITSQAPIVLP
jgi:hypothetical protein